MSKFARVENGTAVEIIAVPDGQEITDLFHPDFVATCFACSEEVVAGWLYDGNVFSAPKSTTITKADLLAYAATRRFVIETGGIILNSMPVMTDRESQSLITGAHSYVQANPDITVRFKTAAGFIELTATQMTAIANTVGAHVQACFAAEGEVCSQIDAGTIKTMAEIDAFAWPSNGATSS